MHPTLFCARASGSHEAGDTTRCAGDATKRQRSAHRSVGARTALAAGVLGSCLFGSSVASASGYLTARFGTDHGTPATPNTFAVYFNPAALGGTTGTTITGDVSAIVRWVGYTRTVDALSPSDPSLLQDQNYVAANTGKANLLNLLAVPFVGANTDFGGSKYLRGGYAFYIPFGGLATWDRRAVVAGAPGTVDGVQRWHNISGQILAIYNTFALSLKVHPRFTVGASISPVIHSVKTVRARNSDGSDDTFSAAGGLVEGRSLLEAHGLNIGAAVGLYWEPTDALKFGLSYTAQPGFGQTRMSGELQTQLTNTNPGAPSKVDFVQTYPDIVRFGAAWKANEKLELRGDFEFVRWSVFDRQCVVQPGQPCDADSSGRSPTNSRVILNVPRNWNNAIGLRMGPGYQLTDDLELFGSLGLTTPAVPTSTIDASTIDALRLYGTFGARYRFSQHFALAGSANYIHFFPVDTKGANNQDLPGVENAENSRSPSADGVYRSAIGFLNVNAAYTF